MNTKTKIMLILITTIFLAGCVTSNEEASNDWKTYTNDQYGYSFEYPSTCFFGPMPADCKQNPPEERAPECLCFLNGEDPNNVFLQRILIEEGAYPMATFTISYYDTPAYNVPAGTELIPWLEENWSYLIEDISLEINTDVGRIPAVEIYTPRSQGAGSARTIFFIKGDQLFTIYMVEPDNQTNNELYNRILSTFVWEE